MLDRASQQLVSLLRNGNVPLAGLVATVLFAMTVVGVRLVGGLERVELLAYDRMVEWRANRTAGESERLAYILATEDDLGRFGWPLSDAVLASVLKAVRTTAPRVIGIDIFRPQPVPPGSEELDGALLEEPPLIWVNRFRQTGWAGIAGPSRLEALGRTAFSDVVPDGDGVIRRGLLYVDDESGFKEALAIKLALAYLEKENVKPAAAPDGSLQLNRVELAPLESRFGAYSFVDAAGYQILYEFRGPLRAPVYSVGDVVDGRIDAGKLRDRVVVVGTNAFTVKDSFTTPIELAGTRALPGAVLHGVLALQLVAHALDDLRPTRPLPQPLELSLIGAACVIGGLIGILVSTRIGLAVALASGGLAIVAGCLAAFAAGLWLPVVPLTVGYVLAGVLAASGMAYAMRSQVNALKRLFSAHVSEEIASHFWQNRSEVMRNGRLIPSRLRISVLFSDINDFTTTSEALDPAPLTEWLNLYMDAMTRVILEGGGVVDKFAGDGITAMWGVPVPRRTEEEIRIDATRAVRTALRMRGALTRVNSELKSRGFPEIRMAVGLEAGEVVGCSIGTARRQQYTTVGDTTNTAARLVTVAKAFMKSEENGEACAIVLGGSLVELVGADFDLSPLGDQFVKGKRNPVTCYSLNGENTGRGMPEIDLPEDERATSSSDRSRTSAV